MTGPKDDDDVAPAALSPEAALVLKRARLSFLVSMGILLVGLMVVAGVLVFRGASGGGAAGPTAAASYSLGAATIPQGAELISAVAAEGRITLTYRLGVNTSLRILDGATGAILREVPIVAQ